MSRAACRKLAAALILAAAPAGASTILSTTGAVTQLALAPGSVVEEALESDTRIFAFRERNDDVLASALSVDVIAPGTYPSSPGTSLLAAGTRVDVFFLQMDIVDSGDGGLGAPRNLSGALTFDSDILGVIGSSGLISASDALGSPTTSYPTGTASRGFWEGGDSLTLSADRRTLTIGNMRVFNNFTDQLRVLVVPEPGTASLVGLGLAGLTLLGSRQRRRRRGRASRR